MPSNPILHPRIPLPAKILLWFFLNVVLLAAVFVFLFNFQFHFDLNWFLTGSAAQRIESMRHAVTDALNGADPDDWDTVLERYSTDYHVRLTLFDEDGNRLVGTLDDLPQEVHARMTQPPPPPRPPLVPVQASPVPAQAPSPPSPYTTQTGSTVTSVDPQPLVSTNGTAPFTAVGTGTQPLTSDSAPSGSASAPLISGAAASTPPPQRGGRPFWRPVRDLVRTTGPTHYWLLTGIRPRDPLTGGLMRTVLVADDSSLAMGGLIMDFGPWLKLALGAVLFSVLFWFPLLRGITSSIGKMKQATGRIAEGRFDVRVPARRRDELGELGESINQMASRLDGFVKGQKRFLGDIAHELCSPLARLQMALGIIETRLAGSKEEPYARTALEKAGQISTLVNALLDFSKASFEAQSVHLTTVDIKDAVEKALAGESVSGASGAIANEEATLDIPVGLTACADPELLIRALANLIRNAIRHNEKVGKIIITGAKRGDNVTISVADCGTGVPEEELPKIFDAFYRLDASRARETGGVGLGLTIVKTCVESCHGTVTARNRHPHGLEVIITLEGECPAKQG